MSPALARTIVEATIGGIKPHRWLHGSGALLLLTYHRILPRDFPGLDGVEPGMCVFDDTFAMHLELLASEFEIVNLGEWLLSARAGRQLPRRACAITFDDGWRDNYVHAFPVLRRHGARATVFVVSSLVGTGASFWPERLARLLLRDNDGAGSATQDRIESAADRWLRELRDRSGVSMPVDREGIAKVIHAAKAFSNGVIESHLESLERSSRGGVVPAEPDLLDWEQIREMVDSGLVEIGSHTRTHLRLVEGLAEAELRDEVVESRREIERHTARPSRLFCYPNGDLSAAAEALVRAEYIGACSTQQGWNRPSTDRYRLRRVSVHEDRASSKSAFLAAISGLA